MTYSDFWRSACTPKRGLAQLTALTRLFMHDVNPFNGAHAASVLSQLVSLQKLELPCERNREADRRDPHLCVLAPGLAPLTAMRELRLFQFQSASAWDRSVWAALLRLCSR